MRRSTIDAFFETSTREASKIALRHKVDGTWREWTWTEYGQLVRRAGRALIGLGVPAEGTIAIVGPNRPEWPIAALGAMAIDAAPVGIYTTSTPEQVAFVAGHAGARVAIVHDERQLAKFRAQKAALPNVTRFVLMLGRAPQGASDVLSWEDFLASADAVPEAAFDERMAAIRPEHTASLIYTSGTTGNPKGVMLTHQNLVFAVATLSSRVKLADEVVLSYLPLSHIAEQDISLYGPCFNGGTIAFCEELDKLGEMLREVRPTLFFAVPRVWEKMQAKMMEAGAKNPWLLKKISAWARGVGLRAGHARIAGQPLPAGYGLAKKLVFSKVRERLGLDRCRVAVSGAAAISRSTLEFFLSLDLPIYEVYGMSENAAVSTINIPGEHRIGTVGRQHPGIELKLASDGEILTRGKHVFKGYLSNEEATREALDADGWLHTGDVGEFDADGYLRITDRKKDLFKTAGGKYIAPQHLEGLIKSIAGVSQVAILGDARKFVAALITLDPETAPRVATAQGVTGKDLAGLAEDRAFLAYLDGEIKKVNASLARYETVKRFRVLPVDFSIDGGELTPTMKLKRKIVSQKYAREIEALYAEAGALAAD